MLPNLKASQMESRQPRYFAQIVENESLSKASRQLFIAQPALSQQVSKLEAEVGKPLLKRSSKGVTPTDSGLALYHHAKFVLRQLDNALRIARHQPGRLHGMVSMGVAATTLNAMGAPLVPRIRVRYPGIVLNVVEGMSSTLAQMMRTEQVDMAILFSEDAVPGMSCMSLLDEELFVIVPSESNLVARSRRRLTLAQAAALRLILPTGIQGLRRRINAEFEQRKLSPKLTRCHC